MLRRLCLFLLIASFAGGLAGCHRGSKVPAGDDRFLGQWTFDRAYTEAHLPKPPPSPSAGHSPRQTPVSEGAGIAREVNGILDNTVKPMLTEQLIGQMDGQTFRLTPKLITDSSDKTRTYEIVERATPNDLSIKLSDGEIWTLTMEDGKIFMPTTGGVHFKLFFKRIDQ